MILKLVFKMFKYIKNFLVFYPSFFVILCRQKMHGMKPPSWVTSDVMEKLEVLKNFGFQIMFGVYKRKEKSRLQGGEG